MSRRAAKTDFASAFLSTAPVTVNGVHPRCNEFDACALIDSQQGRSARKLSDDSTDIEARAFSRRFAFNPRATPCAWIPSSARSSTATPAGGPVPLAHVNAFF